MNGLGLRTQASYGSSVDVEGKMGVLNDLESKSVAEDRGRRSLVTIDSL